MRIVTRTTFKLLAVLLTIAGVLTVIYAIFFVQIPSINIVVEGMELELREYNRETRYLKILVGFSGAIMIFLGYKSYKFIPYAEREKETVSELDLSPDEIY